VALDRGGRLGDARPLLLARHVGLTLAVGPAMADDLVTAAAEGRDHLRAVVVERRVGQQRKRQVVGFGQLQQAPGANPVAVIAPGEAALVRRGVRRRVVVAQPLAERKVLDVEA